MIRYENECVGCPPDLGCMGDSCPCLNVPRLYCDECGNEECILYWWYGQQICWGCIEAQLERVEIDD